MKKCYRNTEKQTRAVSILSKRRKALPTFSLAPECSTFNAQHGNYFCNATSKSGLNHLISLSNLKSRNLERLLSGTTFFFFPLSSDALYRGQLSYMRKQGS